MKKLILFGIVILFLTGCNYRVFDFKYTYNKIVCNYDGDKFELKIDKWTDYDGEQLQIESGNKIYLLSANHCYMVKEGK